MRLNPALAAIAFAAVCTAALLPGHHPANAQLGLIDAQMSICKAYLRHDVEEARECFAEVERDIDREQARLEGLQAKQNAARAFLARHGIEHPDLDAKYQVAKRQGILFAVILSECWNRPGGVDAMEHCLDQREKAEGWLGNSMDKPQ